MKEQERNAVLNAAVDIIVKSGMDICQLCEWYNREEQLNDGHDDPCPCRRKDGDVACREGIINRLRRNLLKSGELSEQKTGFTIHKKDGSSKTVYATNFFGTMYEEKRSHSKVGGINQMPRFQGIKPTMDEMAMMGSHFFDSLDVMFERNGGNGTSTAA